MPTWPCAPAPLTFGMRSSAACVAAQREVERDVEALEEARDQPAFLGEEREEKMLHIDGLVAQPDRLLLRGGERRRGLLGEFIQVHACNLARPGEMQPLPGVEEGIAAGIVPRM